MKFIQATAIVATAILLGGVTGAVTGTIPNTIQGNDGPDGPNEVCVSLDQALHDINALKPISLAVPLDLAQSARVLAWYNAVPPEGNDHYNFIVIIRHADNRMAVILGNDGQICTGTLIGPELVPSLMEAIAGQPAGLSLPGYSTPPA